MRPGLRFAPPRVEVGTRSDGTMLVRSPEPLRPPGRASGDWLEHWARVAPARTFLAERAGDGWRTLAYGAALEAARRVGAALLARGLGPGRPLAILADNGIDHALVLLGALHVGVPAAPLSPAYSLLSRDHAKLRALLAHLDPGLLWVDDPERHAAALAAVGRRPVPLAELLLGRPGPATDAAFAALAPDTLAKILFTSGSTGAPKGVLTTQRMLCANQQQMAQGWPFLEDRPPVVVDWLPWSHTFGGNHNFNLVLRNGGTLYVDGGKPAPVAIETTVRNLREVSPTLYFNVPRGYDLLLPFLEADAGLRRAFFARLDGVFYAAAALPAPLWQRLAALAAAEGREDLAMLSAWGATETSPLATQVHFPIPRAGVVGLPVAGCELKLVPTDGKLEARVRGPHVTPGYLHDPASTAAAFDEEGFYRTGDALRFADARRPEAGLVFDGRLAEDFKLASGTWVRAGAVRGELLAAAAPLLLDAVLTGHDRDEVGALAFLHPAAAALEREALRAALAAALAALAAQGGATSIAPRRLLVLAEPPSLDAGEITDKGSLNARRVLERRRADVERLQEGPPAVHLPGDPTLAATRAAADASSARPGDPAWRP